ncbi:MAG: AAA family ATPase [Euryarchaeota archaeon]|nr:AAA family ATPase [Euryarchaeota archaeon]
MGSVVTFAHHKGGTGKTTTCINVAGFAHQKEAKVLVVDVDPQANATSGLGVDVSTIKGSMYDVLTGGLAITDVILETESGIHLAPSTLDLVGAEPWLYAQKDARVERLARALEPVKPRYDLVLIDTPPGAGVLMMNGIAAADRIVVTLDPGIFALEDVKTIETLLADVSENVGSKRVADIAVVTRAMRPRFFERLFGADDNVNELASDLRRSFRSIHVVPFDRVVFESQRLGVPISDLDPDSPAGSAYRDLAREVMNHG